MKKKNWLLVIIVIILLLGFGFVIYNNLLNDNKVLSKEDALTLGKNKYNELENYISNILSTNNNDFITSSDGYVKYYYQEDLEKKFKNIFSSNTRLNDLFLGYLPDSNKCTSDSMNINPESCHESFSYIKKNNKYYVDSECRASGFTISVSDWEVTKITGNMINYSYKVNQISGSCLENCETKLSKNMQLIKEDNIWKINKVSIATRCGYLIDVNN